MTSKNGLTTFCHHVNLGEFSNQGRPIKWHEIVRLCTNSNGWIIGLDRFSCYGRNTENPHSSQTQPNLTFVQPRRLDTCFN